MKKVLLFIMAAVIILGCAACKNDNSGSADPTAGNSQNTAAPAITPDSHTAAASTAASTPTPESTSAPTSAPGYDWENDWDVDVGWEIDENGEVYADGSNLLTRVSSKKTYDLTTVKSVTVEFMYSGLSSAVPDGNFGIGFLNPSEEFYLFNINPYVGAGRIYYFLNMNSGSSLSDQNISDYDDEEWHTLKVTVSSDEIMMYLDDTLIGSENKGGYDKVINGSSIFLQSYNSFVSFRNIVIE